MKLAVCVLFISACLLHQASAQQNWWETGPDGSPMVATSRTTTTTTVASQTPPAPTNCPCATTPEYNPVCGDLGGDSKMTYTNPGMLECARNCGQSVRLLFYGRCEKVA